MERYSTYIISLLMIFQVHSNNAWPFKNLAKMVSKNFALRSLHTRSNALVLYKKPWYRKFGLYAAGLGIGSAAAGAYKISNTPKQIQTNNVTQPTPCDANIGLALKYAQKSPPCPRLPTLDVEDAPAPLQATFSVYGRGHIRCDATDQACAQKLKAWTTHGADFAQCLMDDFQRSPQTPRSTNCQKTLASLDLYLPEPTDRKLPIADVDKASWSSTYDENSNSAQIAFYLTGLARCKEGNIPCNNALYLLSKSHKDFSRCAKERINDHVSKPDAVCYSIFDLLEKSGPDVATFDHIPTKLDLLDVRVDIKKS